MTLNGHKGQVTALKYNREGSLLASGAQDTDIIVWDVSAESGLYRLRGHQDQVTDLVSAAAMQSSASALRHAWQPPMAVHKSHDVAHMYMLS